LVNQLGIAAYWRCDIKKWSSNREILNFYKHYHSRMSSFRLSLLINVVAYGACSKVYLFDAKGYP